MNASASGRLQSAGASAAGTGATAAAAGALAEEHAKKLLPQLIALESIRLMLGEESISVPGIVVAGAQSAGKSSVLESLSGVNLPRGETIETRVPLFMRLMADSSLSSSFAEIATSPDMRESYVRLDDLGAISPEIRRLTVLLAGPGGHVKNTPIYLNVTHPRGPTMTVIDLPGITHIAAEEGVGDIHAETVGLVNEFIAKEEMIILAVAPATEDLHNAEAIALARKVDPAGKRTLGVITKCDMSTADTGLAGKLRAEEKQHVRLALGMVGVRNRTQAEVNDGITPEEVRRREAHFFESADVARGIPRRCWGMDTLTNRIVELQTETVKVWMQGIQARLRKEIVDAKKQLSALPDAVETPEAQRLLLSKGVLMVQSIFSAAAEARAGDLRDKTLNVSARADALYARYCAALVEATPNFMGVEMFERVQQELEETRGAALSNFLDKNVFKTIIMDTYRDAFKEAGSALIGDLRHYVQECLGTLLRRDSFQNFPLLLDTLSSELIEFLDKAGERAELGLEYANDAQEHIGTRNHYYMETVNNFRVQVKQRQELLKAQQQHKQPDGIAVAAAAAIQTVGGMLQEIGLAGDFLDKILNGSNEEQAVLEMQASLHAYSKLILKVMQDMVPKVAHRALVDKVADNFFEHMNSAFPADRLASCMVEDRHVAAARARASQRVERLENALDVIKALPA